MSISRHVYELESISHELDLVVFRLEHDPGGKSSTAPMLQTVRTELEQLRDRMRDLVRAMERR